MTGTRNYTFAAILQFLVSRGAIGLGLIDLPRGAADLDVISNSPPYFVMVITTLIGALGLISAYGVWRSQRWGVILTIVLRAVDGLLALPGIFWAPTASLSVMATIGVIVSVAIIVLLLRSSPRPVAV